MAESGGDRELERRRIIHLREHGSIRVDSLAEALSVLTLANALGVNCQVEAKPAKGYVVRKLS